MVLVTIPPSVRVKRTTLSCEFLSNSALRSGRRTGGWGRVCAARRRVLVPCRCGDSFPTRLRIVFVGTEVSPWSKVGGLGDVLGSLPPALAKRGHRVMTVSPRYEAYDDIYDSGYLIPVEIPEDAYASQENSGTAPGNFSRLFLSHQESVDRVFVDHPLFKCKNRDRSQWRKMIYPYHGGDSKEFEICCSILCQSALAAPAMVWGKGYSERGGPKQDEYEGENEENLVFVANDWPCGILPLWLENYKQHLDGTPPVLREKVYEHSSVSGRGNSFNVGKHSEGGIEGTISHTDSESISEAGGHQVIGIGGPLPGEEIASEDGGNTREKEGASLKCRQRRDEEVDSVSIAALRTRNPPVIEKSKPKIDREENMVDADGREGEDGVPIPLVDASDKNTDIENISNRGLNEGKLLESSNNSITKAKKYTVAAGGAAGAKPERTSSVSASDFENEIGSLQASRRRATSVRRVRNRRESDKHPLISGPRLDKFQSWVGAQVANSKIVFAIHNMAYQGRNLLMSLGKIRFPWSMDEAMNDPAWDWNWLKVGLLWSDKAVTVSPGYAAELMKGGQESCGMGETLRTAGGVTGIRNGLDISSWNPKTDKFLAEELRYGVEDISEKKAAAKALLQKKLGLKVSSKTPLLGFVGRLEFQKGADMLLSAAPELITQPEIVHPPNFGRLKRKFDRSVKSRGARKVKSHRLLSKKRSKRKGFSKDPKQEVKVQLVMLGRGDQWLEEGVKALKYSFPGNAAGITEFDEELAHLIMAGCDYLIVPSRFEPCGLVAMCAVAYGCIPIVAPVGGLMELAKEEGVGYVLSRSFHGRPYRDGVKDLVGTVRRAVRNHGSKGFSRMRRKCMSIDMSWDGPAEKWEEFLIGIDAHTDWSTLE
ncbi:hypothetical protein BSKO_05851 [Bryopsis sp. KO-2023]|nr:hypothetical protein BSKO_05851 [Bryopsis sp. KO-2023]